jgi:hypothetical protein
VGNSKDNLAKEDFDLLKQEFSSTRFYSKCLSGASYVTINNLDNIYDDVLGEYEPQNWFVVRRVLCIVKNNSFQLSKLLV